MDFRLSEATGAGRQTATGFMDEPAGHAAGVMPVRPPRAVQLTRREKPG